jgi:type III restriction enzyme
LELKTYQQKVIKDLETYLKYLNRYDKLDEAFNEYWSDRIGPYNPLTGEGMQLYKNHISGVPHVSIKVPTAGGKTFIACNALKSIFGLLQVPRKVVIWLVPWSNLLEQTVKALRDPDHPYRQKLNSFFNHRVEVYEKSDLLQGSNFNDSVVKEQLSIIVMNFSSLRAKNKEDRKVYQENGQLASFVGQYEGRAHLLPDSDESSLINVIRSFNPVVIVDESHNAESDLSVEMLNNLNPSFVLDLTATPKENSNIISLVPAIELKKENMVKLPVIVYNHHDKTEVVNSALHLQHKLELLAREELANGGRYIRPIVLFQAQAKTNEDNTTFEKLKEQLLQIGIPEEQVKIKTANKDELKGINLMEQNCPVRYIITINALKEGWDCPFAYILASLSDKSSAVDVEQILGRVLRQPYVMNHTSRLLNASYVLTASSLFHQTIQNIVEGLQKAGFSDKDFRGKDGMEDGPIKEPLFPSNTENLPDEINSLKINFDPAVITDVISSVESISEMVEKKGMEIEAEIKKQANESVDENIFQEMGEKIKRYGIIESHKELAAKIKLPQFFLSTPINDIFGNDKILLNQESLLKNFKLSSQDSNVEFSQIASDLYEVDIEETKKGQYEAKYKKIEDRSLKDPLVDYILTKPKENQIKDISHQLIQLVGSMYPIADIEIRAYIEKVLTSLSTEQLHDILIRRLSYADKIKDRIRYHAESYAEVQFDDMIKVKKIITLESWAFPKSIVPGLLGPSIGNSLYEKEGSMNNFEASVITSVASQQNIAFWHRNLVKGKGFAINGFKSNHYPDFIAVTTSGNVIVIETKGDDRDNSDSAAKCRLGNKWSGLAGQNFSYFMVFDKKQVQEAYTVNKAIELIKQL